MLNYTLNGKESSNRANSNLQATFDNFDISAAAAIVTNSKPSSRKQSPSKSSLIQKYMNMLSTQNQPSAVTSGGAVTTPADAGFLTPSISDLNGKYAARLQIQYNQQQMRNEIQNLQMKMHQCLYPN